MIFNRCHLELKKNLASLALSPIFLCITAVMQLLATFDKNLNIVRLFDFHHIFFELSVLLQTSQPNRGFENFTVCFRQYLRISAGIFFPAHTIQLKYHFHSYLK